MGLENQNSKLLSKFKKFFSSAEEDGDTLVEETEDSVFPSQMRIKKVVLPDLEIDQKETVMTSEYPSTKTGHEAPSKQVQKEDLDILFAENLIKNEGKFVYCNDKEQLIENLIMLKSQMKWNHIFCWESVVKNLFDTRNFQKNIIGFLLENSDAAISCCDSVIASTGDIILSSKQASRRRLSIFPQNHILIVHSKQVHYDLEEALNNYQKSYSTEIPSLINMSNSTVEKKLVLNAEGTKNVFVLFLDETIENS